MSLRELARRLPETGFAVSHAGSDSQLTYAELGKISLEIAEFLTKQGIRPGDRVAFVLPKRPQTIAVILGILHAGASYVPVDKDAPEERLRQILDDVAPAAVITLSGPGAPLPGVGYHINMQPQPASTPELAYVLYTSGSTGTPKGVEVTTSAAEAFIGWAEHAFRPSSSDVFCSLAPFHFDLSVFDIFLPLRAGTPSLLFDSEAVKNPRLVLQALAETRVTIIYTTPTLLGTWMQFGKPERHDFSAVRLILFAGETMPVDLLAQLREVFPQATFYNLYGPTETNVCMWWRVPKRKVDVVYLGEPVSHYEVRFEPYDNERSELWFSGSGLMRGYRNQSDQIRQMQVLDGQRWYASGDLVIQDSQGIRFAGRKDRMIKRRGYRIEPAEIEAVMSQHESIDAVVVTVRQGQVPIIIAHFMASSELDPVGLKAWCGKHLLHYMIPDRFKQHQQFPMTSTGKIDRQQLQQA